MLVEAARFASQSEAQVARSALEASGIGCVLFDAAMHGYVPGDLVAVRLMVVDDDLPAARPGTHARGHVPHVLPAGLVLRGERHDVPGEHVHPGQPAPLPAPARPLGVVHPGRGDPLRCQLVHSCGLLGLVGAGMRSRS